MATRMESLTLEPSLASLAPQISKRDFAAIKATVHSLKGSAGYVGASRIHYCCKRMQTCYLEEQHESMLELYPYLIEAVQEFRTDLQLLLAA